MLNIVHVQLALPVYLLCLERFTDQFRRFFGLLPVILQHTFVAS
jgi:hypothetical protein